MASHDFECTNCHNMLTNVLIRNDADLEELRCECGSQQFQKCFSGFGGYKIKGDNSASTTPKTAGGFKRAKT